MEQPSFFPEHTKISEARLEAVAIMFSGDKEPTPERIAALEALHWVERLRILEKIKRFHQTWWNWYHEEIDMRQ